MSRGGSTAIIGGIIFVVSVVCAIIFNLWRPVFISIAAFGLLIFLVSAGSGVLVRKVSDICGGISIFVGKLATKD